ncbi:MAG: adenylosuccinate synthase [Lentisphaeraceae bacterium]|nr:adenylosuccinate synthase [Lentisphaeraceae bacterium]
MPVTVLIGAQWGDEGKGKIIDVLSENADLVARFQGGNNAGHTVIVEGKKYVLHLIPSGVHSEKTTCMIGNGVVVNPVQLLEELDGLLDQGIDITRRFQISNRAQLVFSYHCEFDALSEKKRGDKLIGTTKKGIGPAYSDKVNRCGLRAGDILRPEKFESKFRENIARYNKLFAEAGVEVLDVEEEWQKAKAAGERLKPFISDTVVTINKAIQEDKDVLLEGAQGVWLDIDYGTFPYVTSSNTGTGGACTGAGVAPIHIKKVIGVTKAYTTRVGEGPFPTELDCEFGEQLRQMGGEFGATTGRPRRCGWFDAVATNYAMMLNGVTDIAITKMDVLDTLTEIKICTGYEVNGEVTSIMPVEAEDLYVAKPVFETMPGWQSPTTEARSMEELPEAARKYLARVAELCGAKISIVSVGPGREATFQV